MLTYDLTERAVSDLRAAREWYDRLNVDLGNRLVDDVLGAVKLARERPTSFPLVKRNVRTVRCKRFPYRVYFRDTGEQVVVLAIYHTARDPRGWDNPTRT
jgi:toxin ParE1/3/4